MSDAAALLAVNATFSSFGKAATYTAPGGGDPVACVAILDRSDRSVNLGGSGIEANMFAEGDTIEVRAAEVVPARGGTFTINAVDYTVQGDPKAADPDRLVWACSVAA